MTPIPGAEAEDNDAWYEEELDALNPHILSLYWVHLVVFASAREAYDAAKRGDRVAQRLLKETYERYIVAKLTG
jgi:surface polysaccharide O-acyltransferase-like enzyme